MSFTAVCQVMVIGLVLIKCYVVGYFSKNTDIKKYVKYTTAKLIPRDNQLVLILIGHHYKQYKTMKASGGDFALHTSHLGKLRKKHMDNFTLNTLQFTFQISHFILLSSQFILHSSHFTVFISLEHQHKGTLSLISSRQFLPKYLCIPYVSQAYHTRYAWGRT